MSTPWIHPAGPITMWAVISRSARGGENIIAGTIKQTRSDARKAWLAVWDTTGPYSKWNMWKARGYRLARVTVEVAK